ncbi:MAG: Uma2 family endonuclease [Oscillatoriales cyanobacterium RU_3_3]|nr:Uma2 family endonuclease [Microcoleus sp. SU_5_6]NJL66727.1 Uma2 family endonuclease [Microcoleus sp. SM1_3_4]NJM62644.1 Uma2 family endonuclease [Oscillatoriales cyanobacterium RU_3_3]NJR24113.1 Uma2 family endonuclease [Richelia sp. CSU_2_1]
MKVLTALEQEEIDYPSGDGEPMAESDITCYYLFYALGALRLFFQERSDVYISANSYIYYEEKNNKAVVAPDIYAVFGVSNRQRRTYKLWRENGIAPQFVMEVTSETTQENDQISKPEIYKELGVTEYFQYDPSGDYLNPILQGVRLVNGEYEPIAANNISFDTLWLYSEVLQLELHLISGELRFRNPETGEFLRTMEEEQQGRLAEQQGRLAEQQARLAAEAAFQQAEQARLAAQSSLRAVISGLLNSGMSLEQVSQMVNLPISQVQQLIGGNE